MKPTPGSSAFSNKPIPFRPFTILDSVLLLWSVARVARSNPT